MEYPARMAACVAFESTKYSSTKRSCRAVSFSLAMGLCQSPRFSVEGASGGFHVCVELAQHR
jgi:hypothetical protein